jgi:putative ABC transport system permease protein
MNQWLQNFAYKIELSLWVFIASGATTLLVAMITVSVQAIKSAVADPVHSLRNE